MSTVTLATTESTPLLYRNYETRSKSTAQSTPHSVTRPTGNVQKSKMTLKSPTPVLQLGETECATGRKLSSTPIQEAKDNLKPVELQASAAIPGILNPLCDDSFQQSIHYHRLTPDARNVLNKITNQALETGHILEFHDIDAREYEVIEEVLGETGRISKPRLTYDYEKHVLLVDMPSALHEAPFDCLKLYLIASIAALPYDHDTIHAMVQMNSSLDLKRKSVTPDICITVTSAEGPTNTVLVPFLGECACSEDKTHAIRKLKNTISAHSDIRMVVLALMREAQPYSSPEDGSYASKHLRKRREPLPRNKFITERFPPCTSITIAQHNWCHVSSVEFFVWVRGDDERVINLDNEDAEHMAHGTLLPDLNMGAVKAMLERGLEKIRDSFVTFSKQLNPTLDCTELEDATFRMPIIWKDYVIAINNGADMTAWKRYKAWHENVVNDLKNDPTYVPSNNAVTVLGSSSRERPKRKRTSTSLPPRKLQREF